MFKSFTRWKVNNPAALSHRAKRLIFRGLRATSSLRVLPNFLIIGAQKSGTTSLYNYLSLHPQVLPSLKKEVGYFGNRQGHSIDWYRAHFPTSIAKSFVRHSSHRPAIVGEASTTYHFYPTAPAEAFQVLPQAKLILLAREPADRAISHYYHNRKKGLESRSLREAIHRSIQSAEGERKAWWQAAESGETYQEPTGGYVVRGFYSDQIKNWIRYYSPEQLLVLKAEQFWQETETVWKSVLEFLQLDPWKPDRFEPFNEGGSGEHDAEAFDALRVCYQIEYERLANAHVGKLTWGHE